MKKYLLLIFACLLLSGCGDKGGYEQDYNGEYGDFEENKQEEVKTDEVALKDPVLEWCRLYNPNGFNTVTCVISNPNDVDIDASYDLVFYKNGEVVAKKEASDGTGTNTISPTHPSVYQSNEHILKSSEVDEVRMENITVKESYYKALDAKIEHIGITDTKDYTKFIFDEEPYSMWVKFFLYNDNNNNGKCDPEELVIAYGQAVDYTGKERKFFFETDVRGESYTDYEIYYSAYKLKNK